MDPATDSTPDQPQRTEHRATLLRVLDRQTACLVLRSSQSVVNVELDPPLSPRSHANAQTVNALSPVPATVWLGPYDTSIHRFTSCLMQAQLPDQSYRRISYLRRA
jgi:hypothetical protein